jgi:hypothetical protein
MQDIIELPTIMYDVRAKDGTWCQLPYPNHKKGCPNFAKGCTHCGDWKKVLDYKLGERANGCGTHWITYKWYAVIEEFDLEKHANKMKHKHPDWSKKQCYCVLYWQSTVRMKLKAKAKKYLKELAVKDGNFHFDWACHLIEIPEAHGVNVFGTMAKAGLILYKNPKIVRKIMFVGIQQLTPMPPPVITAETPDCIWPYYRHTDYHKCVYGRCPKAGQKAHYEQIRETCELKKPRIETEVAYAREHGFDCILQCKTCGNLEYAIFKNMPNRCQPEHPKCCNELMGIIWLGSENPISNSDKEAIEVKNPWPDIAKAELPGLKKALEKALLNDKKLGEKNEVTQK